jgi:HSP20 family molecular chaperone IbpA
MREVNDAYLLDGEVPGIGQSDIEIDFSDANTLEIKGHGRRDYEKSVTVAVNSSEQATSSKFQQPTV